MFAKVFDSSKRGTQACRQCKRAPNGPPRSTWTLLASSIRKACRSFDHLRYWRTRTLMGDHPGSASVASSQGPWRLRLVHASKHRRFFFPSPQRFDAAGSNHRSRTGHFDWARWQCDKWTRVIRPDRRRTPPSRTAVAVRHRGCHVPTRTRCRVARRVVGARDGGYCARTVRHQSSSVRWYPTPAVANIGHD